MNVISRFIEDALVTLYKFVIELFLFVTSIVACLVIKTFNMLHGFFVNAMVPGLLDVLTVINYVLNMLYEELLVLVCGACITACSLLVKLGRRCQELREQHLRHKRWP